MILDDFAYFKYNSTYNEFATNPGLGISEGTIVFVEDTGNIYARGHQFGGKYEYQGEDGVIVDGNTITLDIDYINENLMPEKTVYTAGNYINISNTNKISVDLESLKDALDNEIRDIPVASATTLGGIKVGYNDGVTSNIAGRNYKVQLDSNNNAFVYVPWTDTKPTPSESGEPGATKDYVDGKVASLTDRLNNIVSEINWDELFDEYGVKPNAGQEVDPEESTITQWVHDPDNIALVWQQLTASNAKPSWVSVVATKYDEWITGTQIQQLENQISLIAGNFDSNGDPIEGKWSGIILTAKDEHGKSVIDLAADQVIASGEIVTPAVVSTAINAEDITVTSKLTATNADITGNITANQGTFTNCTIDETCTIKGELHTTSNILYWNDTYTLPSIQNVHNGYTVQFMVMQTKGLGSNRNAPVLSSPDSTIIFYSADESQYLPQGSAEQTFELEELGKYIVIYNQSIQKWCIFKEY